MSSTKILFIVNAILAVVIVGVFSFMFLTSPKKNEPQKNIVRTEKNEVVGNLNNDDHEAMEEMIKKVLGKEADRFAIFIYRPKKDLTPIIFNSHKMRPASMIKMFVLAKAMQDVKDGKLSLDENLTIAPENIVGGAGSIAGYGANAKVPVRLALELMTKESDNTATNILIDRIGMNEINKYIREQGYTDTEFQHKMMLAYPGLSNYSSARDLGKLFTKIYDHDCVDDYYDSMMIDFLLKQEDMECLPAALPAWNVAHKTGDAEQTYHDGGICYGKRRDFIIVLMNDNYVERGESILRMRMIAATVANN